MGAISLGFGVMLTSVGHLAAAPAARQAGPPGPTIVRLAVDPAAEPGPALKYAFLRPLDARKPGNAAPFYYRALLYYTVYRRTLDKRLDKWHTCPLTSFRGTKCGRPSMDSEAMKTCAKRPVGGTLRLGLSTAKRRGNQRHRVPPGGSAGLARPRPLSGRQGPARDCRGPFFRCGPDDGNWLSARP